MKLTKIDSLPLSGERGDFLHFSQSEHIIDVMGQSNSQKIENYKTIQYGLVAKKFRRGIISLEEAQHLWDKAEGDAQELYEMDSNCVSDFQREVLNKALDNI